MEPDPESATDLASPRNAAALDIINALQKRSLPLNKSADGDKASRKWPRPERLHHFARAVVRARKLGGGTRKESDDHQISIPRRSATSVGIHGSSVFKDYEAPNPSASSTVANVMSKCGNKPSAARLGRACALVDSEGHSLLRATWQEPATSLGGPTLFDSRLGGNKIFLKRDGMQLGILRQHANASQNPD
eukprot:2279497-Rhodomonas_salina.1